MLYHVTWKSNLPSIREKGLLPNFRPNAWTKHAAREHSKGKVFLTVVLHVPSWLSALRGTPAPVEGDEVVVVEVHAQNAKVGLQYTLEFDDRSVESGVEYTTDQAVPPEHLGEAWTFDEFWRLVKTEAA